MVWMTFAFGWSMGVFTTLAALFGLSIWLAKAQHRKRRKRERTYRARNVPVVIPTEQREHIH